MGTFRIVVADNHPIFRYGLCALLRAHVDWEVCGEAIDGQDAVDKCRDLKPDLLILDVCLPKLNGASAVRRILKDNPGQRILVLTNVQSEQVIRECLEAGVRGWVYKSDEIDDLTQGIEALQRHRSQFSAQVSDMLLRGYLWSRMEKPNALRALTLSLRQREVVQLVAEGKSSKEIATLLSMSTKTVETHRTNILRRLDLHSIADLVLYAVRNEIVHVPTLNVTPLRRPQDESIVPYEVLSPTAHSHPGNGKVDVVA